jgi:isocitrate lyase
VSLKRNLIPAEDVRVLGEFWRNDLCWAGVTRTYTAEKVLRLRGTIKIEHTIADKMSRKLWNLLRHPAVYPRSRRAYRQPNRANGSLHRLQEKEFVGEPFGYGAVKRQAFVGADISMKSRAFPEKPTCKRCAIPPRTPVRQQSSGVGGVEVRARQIGLPTAVSGLPCNW